MDNIYTNLNLKAIIIINPDEINIKIDDIIKKKLIEKVGGKCINEGYVDKDSIKLIERSSGVVHKNNLSGSIRYNVIYSANIGNIFPGNKTNVYKCKVV